MNVRKRIGVLTGGGDCPGLNAAIRAVAKKAIREGYEVVGICDGWQGLIGNRTVSLDEARVSGIIDRGGTILGTSRINPLSTQEVSGKVFDNFKNLGLEGLVVLGGDGTLAATARVSKLGLPVVGIPKTIDNDIRETETTIGFQTAVQIATDALDRLRSTGESHHRVMVVEVMGRNAGWIATYAGMANGADAILIPEVPLDKARLEELCQIIKRRDEKGKRFSIVVVAEGIQLPECLPVKEGQPAACHTLGGLIEGKTGLETRVTTLGYIQRGGTPVAFDRSLATIFGVRAVELIQAGEFGVMTAVKGDKIVSVPLEKVAGGIKTVDPALYKVAEVFFG